MITVSVANADRVAAALAKAPDMVLDALRVKIDAQTVDLQAYVITQKLHGQVLHQRSSALAKSIQREEAAVSGDVVQGKVFSSGDVKYAGIHEYGGTIPAHDVVATKAQALAFVIDGKQMFAKSVHIPDVHMPERSFLRSSLAENREQIMHGLEKAAAAGVRKALGE